MQTSTRMVQEVLHDTYIDRFSFEGRVVDIITELQSVVKRHGNEVRIDWAFDYDDDYCPRVVMLRPENEYEINVREIQEARYKEMRRQQFEQMKKEFEGEQS